MKIKKAGLVLVTSALVSIGAMVSYAGATGIQGVDAYNTQSQTSGTTTDQTAGTAVDNSQAAALINGFAAKLNATQNFGVKETVNMNMSTGTDSMNSVTESYSIVNGENVHSTMNTIEYENGAVTETKASEFYTIYDGVNYKRYEIASGTVANSEVMQTSNIRENYFPIKYHGNETVTIENGEFVVRGYTTKEDFAGSSALNSVENTGDTTYDYLYNMPYELHFNANGDLTFMQVDMSSLMDTLVSMISALYGADAAGLNISSQLTYMVAFNLDPSQTFAVPYYLN